MTYVLLSTFRLTSLHWIKPGELVVHVYRTEVVVLSELSCNQMSVSQFGLGSKAIMSDRIGVSMYRIPTRTVRAWALENDNFRLGSVRILAPLVQYMYVHYVF